MFTASNFDGDPHRKKPESGRSYTRKALGGLGKNDVELWLTDSQDRGGAPVARPLLYEGPGGLRPRATWFAARTSPGATPTTEVQFANGDTFHTTNCSPQVAGFNQPRSMENWGDLEKFVSAQSGTDRVSVFAGPVLADDDPIFVGVDQDGPVRVQIPQQYWKVIAANDDGELRAFAFLLQQDLSDVPLEFAVDAAWSEHMLGIGELEDLLGQVRFPDVVREADQADTDDGEAVRSMAHVDRAAVPARPVSARRRPGIEREIPTPNSGDDSYAEPGLDRSTPPGTDLETVTPWRVAKSLLALRRQVNERAPNRSKASDGTIGDAAHATRNSDHNPWVMEGGTGVVTAMDVTHDPANGCDADQLAEAIRAARDRRVKYLIWNRRIASAAPIDGAVAWTWRPYGGANPHAHHLHVSVQPDAATYDSELPWAI